MGFLTGVLRRTTWDSRRWRRYGAVVIFGSTEDNLRENVNVITGHPKCNVEKTKTMIIGNESLAQYKN